MIGARRFLGLRIGFVFRGSLSDDCAESAGCFERIRIPLFFRLPHLAMAALLILALLQPPSDPYGHTRAFQISR